MLGLDDFEPYCNRESESCWHIQHGFESVDARRSLAAFSDLMLQLLPMEPGERLSLMQSLIHEPIGDLTAELICDTVATWESSLETEAIVEGVDPGLFKLAVMGPLLNPRDPG